MRIGSRQPRGEGGRRRSGQAAGTPRAADGEAKHEQRDPHGGERTPGNAVRSEKFAEEGAPDARRGWQRGPTQLVKARCGRLVPSQKPFTERFVHR
jgi:hypothetical protein